MVDSPKMATADMDPMETGDDDEETSPKPVKKESKSEREFVVPTTLLPRST